MRARIKMQTPMGAPLAARWDVKRNVEHRELFCAHMPAPFVFIAFIDCFKIIVMIIIITTAKGVIKRQKYSMPLRFDVETN